MQDLSASNLASNEDFFLIKGKAVRLPEDSES